MSSVWDDPEISEEEVTPLPDIAVPVQQAPAAVLPLEAERFEALAAEILEKVAREIVPEIAERLIREQLEVLMSETDSE
ncbi:MAG: hypothetical protein K8R69_09070 [Deltaproteobacteria bacterium]|nr:hypothetical protein [Deltaproteobacteria bacterium]